MNYKRFAVLLITSQIIWTNFVFAQTNLLLDYIAEESSEVAPESTRIWNSQNVPQTKSRPDTLNYELTQITSQENFFGNRNTLRLTLNGPVFFNRDVYVDDREARKLVQSMKDPGRPHTGLIQRREAWGNYRGDTVIQKWHLSFNVDLKFDSVKDAMWVKEHILENPRLKIRVNRSSVGIPFKPYSQKRYSQSVPIEWDLDWTP